MNFLCVRVISFFFLFSFAFQINSSAQPSVTSYDELVHEVRAAFSRGKERTADAVERERVQTNWEVGKLIDEHILLHQDRADYGKEVIKRLSVDLSKSGTELYYMLQFVRAYPILPTSVKLTWSHYRELLAVNESTNRDALARRASAENWTIDRTRAEIKKLKAENPQIVNSDLADPRLIPITGKLDAYRIVKKEAEQNLLIDLGFSNYFELPRKYQKKFKDGDIVRVSGKGKFEIVKGARAADLYTYRAKVLEITDGDTLWIWIDLGFGFLTKQHVRLRGIDAPEIETRDGQKAKEFIVKELQGVSEIVITTSKSDKYDRYLVDIYYVPAQDVKISAGSTRAARHGYQSEKAEKFLNNELLTNRLAEQVN